MSTAYLAKMRFPWPHSPQFTSITNETKFYSGLRHLGIFHGCRKSLVHEMLKKKKSVEYVAASLCAYVNISWLQEVPKSHG